MAADAAPAKRGTPAIFVNVTEQGKALMPILISDKATKRVQDSAATLADYLKRISGAEFVVRTAPVPLSNNPQGIALGLATDFAVRAGELPANDPTRVEDYILRSKKNALLLVGTTELGVQHAVWALLHRLGHRQFFPGKKWEVIPTNRSIRVAVDVHEHPDYLSRRIWYGFGSMRENITAFYDDWWAKNRVATGVDLTNAHEYASIILRNRAEFTAHPEYYALVGGKRQTWDGGQFCISNPNLRKLVVADALRKLEQNPKLDSISMEPNDGGGWCECPACAKVGNGSVSDRVVTLANEVAAAVTAKYPGKFVGILAYNEHSPPPSIRVHPGVVVSIATGYIRGGFTIDQLIEGWSRQAKTIGIYDYYSFYSWDWDLAGAARVSNTDYMKRTTLDYFQKGARFMNAESSNNWGPNGLGYYLASQLLWDTSQAAHVDEITADFLTKAFGPAREPMAEWYKLIDGANKPLITQDLVGRLYRQLDKALKLTNDDGIRARLYDLALYVRYLDSAIAIGPRKTSIEERLRYAWRIRHTNMVHTLAIWTVSSSHLPPEAAPDVPEEKNPWKSDKPYTPQEIEAIIADGIANNKITDFTPVNFSQNLVPATPLRLKSTEQGDFGFLRGEAKVFAWADKIPATFSFDARCGIGTGAVAWSASFKLFSAGKATGSPSASAPTDSAEVPCDWKNTYPVKLKAKQAGLHSIMVNDGTAGTYFTWPQGEPLTLESGMRFQHSFNGKWSLYFYVPKGTKIVGGYKADATGLVVGPDGKARLNLADGAARDYWSVPVGAGEDGKLWKLQDATREVRLLTVPPYLARSAQELLLPREVVKADGPK